MQGIGQALGNLLALRQCPESADYIRLLVPQFGYGKSPKIDRMLYWKQSRMIDCVFSRSP
jgi:hypothetical protein